MIASKNITEWKRVFQEGEVRRQAAGGSNSGLDGSHTGRVVVAATRGGAGRLPAADDTISNA